MSTELMSRRWRDSVRIARTNQGAMESGPEREIGIAEERKDDMKRLLLVGSLLLSAGAFTAGLVYGQGGRRAAVTPPAASLTSVQQSKIAEFKAAAMTKAARFMSKRYALTFLTFILPTSISPRPALPANSMWRASAGVMALLLNLATGISSGLGR